jgi:D-glycero-D-manno-heptose 1,7-bisphosphate phosphatase
MRHAPRRETTPAIFLDRDDTLNANATLPPEAFPATRGDLFRPEFVRLLPGVFEACARLVRAGFTLVAITNQACVARASASVREVEMTNDRLRELLTHGGRPLLRAVYAAPHHPEALDEFFRGDHSWRKPSPGMLLAAARELDLDLGRSWVIGDAGRDIEAGLNAGLPAERCLRVGPEGDFPGLPDAADHILHGAHPPERDPPPALTASPASIVTLRAHEADALADAQTRRTVLAAASAIAERTGVRLIDLRADDRSITATLATHRLAALGFMAELRRATDTWHHKHHGRRLW